MRQDLVDVLEDRGLHPSVLISCRHLLEGEQIPEPAEEEHAEEDWEPEGGGPTIH
jgi:hypothetical protein